MNNSNSLLYIIIYYISFLLYLNCIHQSTNTILDRQNKRYLIQYSNLWKLIEFFLR